MTKTGKSQQSSAAHRVIKSNIKHPWSKAEDAVLSDSVHKYGPSNWQHIASQLETVRSAKQCRERYHNHLTGYVVKGNWTQEEDNVILKVQRSFGNQWAQITRLLPGRTDNAVKNRFHALVRAGIDKNVDNDSYNIGDDATTMCDTNTVSNYTSSNNTSAATSNMTTSSNTITTATSSSSNSTSIIFDCFEPQRHPLSLLELQQQLLPITAKNLEMLQMQHNYGMFSSNTSFSSGSVVSTASDEVVILCNNNNSNNSNYNSNSSCSNNNNNLENYNSSNNIEYYYYSGNNSSCSSSNSISSAEYMIECEILDYLATELLCDKL